MNPIITLISDWRLRDPYLAIFKGKLLSAIPNANIIDISHHVEMFSIEHTAMLMKHSYQHFPAGTIHLLLTNACSTSTFQPVVLEYDNHFFVGEDNGIFQLMFGNQNELHGRFDETDTTSPSLTKIIALTEAILDHSLENVTSAYQKFKRTLTAVATHNPVRRCIEGEIIFFDAFCNAVTNIPAAMFNEFARGKDFTATIYSKRSWTIKQYSDTYVRNDDMILTRNDLGLIEIAMFQSNISTLASLEIKDQVVITY